MNKLMLAVLCLLIPIAAHASVIQLPQSGQTTTYSTTDDGDIKAGKPWPNPRFCDDGNQTVMDNLTGLIWAKDANLMKNRDPGFDTDGTNGDGAVSWQHALDYIHRLNAEKYLGFNDWRLPNLNELTSLLNQGEAQNSAWLNGQGFIGVQPLIYWSSSSNVLDAGTAWTIAIDSGPVNYLGKSNFGYVWPVRGGQSATVASSVALPRTGQNSCFDSNGTQISCAGSGQDGELQTGVAWPNPRFSDNGDQTVTDNLTGLLWTKDANPISSFSIDNTNSDGSVTWQGALDFMKKFNQVSYQGFNDWRLPNRNELSTLANYVEANPFAWLTWQGFNFVKSKYWSSGTVAPITDNAWNVTPSGVILGENKSGTNGGSFVWPVRGELAGLTLSENSSASLLILLSHISRSAVWHTQSL